MTTTLITIGIFLALVAGFFVGRWHGMSHRSKQLSEELEKKEEELEKLKSGVDEHFSETARLFTNLTEEYKHLYKHLAKGATELSNESFKLSLAAPSEQLIDHEEVSVNADNSEQNESDSEASDIEQKETQDEQPQQPVDYAKPEDEEIETTSEETSESDSSSNDSKSEPKMDS